MKLVCSSTEKSTAPCHCCALSALISTHYDDTRAAAHHEAPCSLVRLSDVVHQTHLACQIPSFILHISHVVLADINISAAQLATKCNMTLKYLPSEWRALGTCHGSQEVIGSKNPPPRRILVSVSGLNIFFFPREFVVPIIQWINNVKPRFKFQG